MPLANAATAAAADPACCRHKRTQRYEVWVTCLGHVRPHDALRLSLRASMLNPSLFVPSQAHVWLDKKQIYLGKEGR